MKKYTLTRGDKLMAKAYFTRFLENGYEAHEVRVEAMAQHAKEMAGRFGGQEQQAFEAYISKLIKERTCPKDCSTIKTCDYASETGWCHP